MKINFLLAWFFNQDTAYAYVPFVYDINEDSWAQRDGFFLANNVGQIDMEYYPKDGYFGPTWYVSSSGSNNNDGSIENLLLQYKWELMLQAMEIRYLLKLVLIMRI